MLGGCKAINGAGWRCIGQLTALESLVCDHCAQLTDAHCGHLKGLARLRHLSVASCLQLGLEAIRCFASMAQLESLDLSALPRLLDDDLQPIARLSRLECLVLDNCAQIRCSAVWNMSRFKTLAYSIHFSCPFRGMGLSHLHGSMGLRRLSLRGCNNLCDAGLCSVALLPGLRTLKLDYCTQITDTGRLQLEDGHLQPAQALCSHARCAQAYACWERTHAC